MVGILVTNNWGISAASFSRHVAAWVSDMFSNFYSVKNHKIADYSMAAKARKNKDRFGIIKILEFLYIFD
jgi:hypothetical protein